jgi:hypothetical protein
MDEKETHPSFSRLVFGRAVADTVEFFGYTRRDAVLAAISVPLGFGMAFRFIGKADTMNEFILWVLVTVAPFGIVLLTIFAWHLWLAPSVLAYETATAQKVTVRPPRSARLTDKNTIAIAGIVRSLAERARRGKIIWPPVEETAFYDSARFLLESSDPIWALSEFNELRESFRLALIAVAEARKGGNEAIVAGALGNLEMCTNALCQRLVDG